MKKIILICIIILAALIRLYRLESTPPSLYWDEASLGYNAYSILKTAKDEHGKFLPLTNFASFGDYKPPGYVYFTVPSVAIFGLNEFAVRFPSAFFGTLTVFLTYLLSKKLFENKKVALVAAFFLAISPWHIQMSRAAFEANLGLFFSALAILLFIKFATEKWYYLPFSAFSFLFATYTFTGQRLFVPFILLILMFQFRRRIISNLKVLIPTIVVAAFLFWPLFIFATQTQEGRLRFEEVNIFKDLEPINQSVKYRQREDFSILSSIIYNRRLFYIHEYLINYFDAFNPSFLFIHGDVNPRLSIQEVGELYLFDLPLILFGIYFIFSSKFKYRWLIVGWLLVSPLGPAVARETPHALRMIHILPTFQIISALGIYFIFNLVKFKKFLIIASAFVVLLSFFYYLHMYYFHWPKDYSGEWQYGYKRAVEIVESKYDEVDNIVVTKSLGRPYIYFLLYMQFDPSEYLKTAQIVKDNFYFLDVDGFDKFYFVEGLDQVSKPGKTLYVVGSDQLPREAQKVATINDLAGSVVFEIGELYR